MEILFFVKKLFWGGDASVYYLGEEKGVINKLAWIFFEISRQEDVSNPTSQIDRCCLQNSGLPVCGAILHGIRFSITREVETS